jgi:hypothetical protein
MDIVRHPYMVVYEEHSARKDVYGGAENMVAIECMRVTPANILSDTAIRSAAGRFCRWSPP